LAEVLNSGKVFADVWFESFGAGNLKCVNKKKKPPVLFSGFSKIGS